MQNKLFIKDNKLVSVVVPVYNSEKYLEKCIDSIVNQTYTRLQIILVNDGSTDGSLSICHEYSEADERISVINQTNCGVAEARKRAVCASSGEWITFVDSDDYIDNDYIEKLLCNAHDCDLVTSGLNYGGRVTTDNIEEGKYTLNEDSPVIRNLLYAENGFSRGILTNMCGKLFKTALAKITAQYVDKDVYYGEDGEFVYKYILACQRINVTKYCGYYYRVNHASICHTYHEDFLININKLYLSLKREFEKSQYRHILIPQLEKWIAVNIRLAPEIMGICRDNLPVGFIIPDKKIICGKKIVVYGAGRVGRDFIRQIVKEDICEDFLWVDRNWINKEQFLGQVVKNPEKIKDFVYDYIIIAVNDIKNAEAISEYLLSQNVSRDKIIWKRPINIVEFYW